VSGVTAWKAVKERWRTGAREQKRVVWDAANERVTVVFLSGYAACAACYSQKEVIYIVCSEVQSQGGDIYCVQRGTVRGR
jgi:hypothetical protein